jgi:hypothetical protein
VSTNLSGHTHILGDEGAYVLGSSFQHAVVRSINDKNAQLQKQLENLVREGTCFFIPSGRGDKGKE